MRFKGIVVPPEVHSTPKCPKMPCLVVDEEDPGHEEPPFLGGGLLHDLDLAFVPVNMLHEPQEPQTLHAPLTRPI